MNIWDQIVLNPLINIIVATSHVLFSNFGLTIIVLTIIIRVATFPLTLKQLRVTKAMQGIQAQMNDLRQKYGKDQQRLAQEQMKLYKQAGMNPLGCVLPLFLQLFVSVALYQSIIRVLAIAPEDFLNMSQRLWTQNFSLVPLHNTFLWLNLANPDTLFILPALTMVTQWAMQKMTTIQTTDPAQQSQNQIMLLMMPVMFGMLTFSFPSGLALYWVASNIIGIVMQSFVTGWGGLFKSGPSGKTITVDKKIKGQAARKETPAETDVKMIAPTSSPEGVNDGKPGLQRQDSRGSDSEGPGPNGPKPGGSGGQRRKRR